MIGRAGIGVDNVDVEAATKRGIIVANAPQSNIVAAAEHTVALMLALARNIPQAHAALTAGKWERSKFGGVEVYEKTLGMLGFGRIGQLVAARARGFGMRVVAFDPFVSRRALPRARRRAAPRRRADALRAGRLHHASTCRRRPRRAGLAQRRGVRADEGRRARSSTARAASCVVDEALKDALDSGKVAGAALDVFPSEPITDHPLFALPQRRRHAAPRRLDRRGAGPRRRADRRAGRGRADRRRRLHRGQHPRRLARRTWRCSARSCRSCQRLGRIATALAEASSIERVEVEYLGRIAERDTRLLTLAVLKGVLAGHTEEDVNLVNAPVAGRGARDRGLRAQARSIARDFTDLVRVTVVSGGERVRVVGTTLGRRHRPHLLEAWGQRFNLQIDDAAPRAVPLLATCPAWSAASAPCFGEHGDQHLRGRRRPPGARARTAPRRRRGDGGHDRRAGAAGRRRDRRLRRLRRRPRGLAD